MRKYRIYEVGFYHSPNRRCIYSLSVDSTNDTIISIWNDTEDEEVSLSDFMKEVTAAWVKFPLYFKRSGKYGAARAFLNQLRKDYLEDRFDDTIWLLAIKSPLD